MLFEPFKAGLENPAFRTHLIRDVNPLSQQVKMRVIADPNREMRILHERIINYLRDLRIPLPYATGAVPGASPVKNARRHWRNRYFYLVDLTHAYSNLKGRPLAKLLCSLDKQLVGQEEEVLAFLRNYCLDGDEGVLTGAPASPDLFNLYLGVVLDQELGEVCERYGITYTRYIDDLVFSSPQKIGEKKRTVLRKVIQAKGFIINHRKCVVTDLHKRTLVITGVGLAWTPHGARTFTPRGYYRKVKGRVHSARRNRRGTNPAQVEGYIGVFRQSLTPLAINMTEQRLISSYRAWRRQNGRS